MPNRPTWGPRAATILREVQTSEHAHFDRKAIEILFDLRGRRAQQVMAVAGVEMVGSSAVVFRDNLVRYLQAFASADLAEEKRRQQAFADRFAKMRQERLRQEAVTLHVEVPTREVREIQRRDLDRLPEVGIELEPGMLRIAFVDGEDLLQKLVKLSEAIGAHHEDFLLRTSARKARTA